MPVINFLPWRKMLYRQRRRRFTAVLLVLTGIGAVSAVVNYNQAVQTRIAYDTRLEHGQVLLSDLEQEHYLLLQLPVDMIDINSALQTKISQSMRQLQWQQLMHEWQLLAAQATVSEIAWHGGLLTLSGVSEAVDPLRRLIADPANWQLQQIELNTQNSYQFVVSRDLHDEVNFK